MFNGYTNEDFYKAKSISYKRSIDLTREKKYSEDLRGKGKRPDGVKDLSGKGLRREEFGTSPW